LLLNGRLLENDPAERRFELTVVSLAKRSFHEVRRTEHYGQVNLLKVCCPPLAGP